MVFRNQKALKALTMQTYSYRISFQTPAFLGNAQQQAQWRTPPFKGLLCQWWPRPSRSTTGISVCELRPGTADA